MVAYTSRMVDEMQIPFGISSTCADILVTFKKYVQRMTTIIRRAYSHNYVLQELDRMVDLSCKADGS